MLKPPSPPRRASFFKLRDIRKAQGGILLSHAGAPTAAELDGALTWHGVAAAPPPPSLHGAFLVATFEVYGLPSCPFDGSGILLSLVAIAAGVGTHGTAFRTL